MKVPVQVQIGDRVYPGSMVDTDIVFLLYQIVFSPEEQAIADQGSLDFQELMGIMNDRQLATLESVKAKVRKDFPDLTGKNFDEKVSLEVNSQFAQGIYFRITKDNAIRDALAQRITEVFPSVPQSFVSYSRDHGGRIRLDTDELLSVLTAMLGSAQEMKLVSEGSRSKKVVKQPSGKGFSSVPYAPAPALEEKEPIMSSNDLLMTNSHLTSIGENSGDGLFAQFENEEVDGELSGADEGKRASLLRKLNKLAPEAIAAIEAQLPD